MAGGLTDLGPFFAVTAHPPGIAPTAPWRPVTELTAGPPGPLLNRIASVRAALAARGGLAVAAVEPRVAGSAVHLGLAARLIAPALAAAVLGGPLDMRPGDLWWQDTAGGPVPLSVRARGYGAAPAEWDRRLLDDVIIPFTDATAQLARVPGRVLRGNVASAVNAAAGQLAARRPDLARDAWRAAARLFATPLLASERYPPGPAFRRSSCCLFYRLLPGTPAAVCGDCILHRRNLAPPLTCG